MMTVQLRHTRGWTAYT